MSTSGTTPHYDVIVIGVGAMGSSTCYQLAKRDKSVLGLEADSIPNTRGSSHGYTRIIRRAYYEHYSYISLLERAYELWYDLEWVSGEKLLHTTGSIDAGPEDSWVFGGSLQSCEQYSIPHEVLTAAELQHRHPAYHLPDGHLALYQPDGGFLLPERCIAQYVMLAQEMGADIHGHEAVLAWEPTENGVRVTSDRGTYEAERLVVTAGAWNSQLLKPLNGLAVPERQVLAWIQPATPPLFQPEMFPVFNLLVDEGRFYGFPIHGVPGFKFGKYHHLEQSGDAEAIDWKVYPEDEALLRQFAEKYFPDTTGGPTMSLAPCMFTNTPDGHFVMDLHPDYPQVTMISPCSGHGFKFTSVIGEIAADLATTGTTRHDISFFRLNRFRGQSGEHTSA